MQLILLAAGKGKRLPKKYRNVPKCFIQIKEKKIIEYNINFFNSFKNKIIITGYKSKKLKNFIKKNKFKEIKNKKFNSTNMVHSLFLASKFINNDVLVCYGDIIFDKKIMSLIKEKSNIMPVNVNWIKIWKKRMSRKQIIKDAENLIIKKNYITEIGGQIKKKLPDYQYMGIFKLKKNSFHKLNLFYKKINNSKIDMTSFLNKSIKHKIINIKIKKYNSFWYEFDTLKDIKNFELI